MSIFLAKPSPRGFNFTIVTKFGRMLEAAESLFGKRDKSYTILGIECNQLEYPQIWFPGDVKDIVIQVTEDCIEDMNRAVYQVAHETIHCLTPTKENNMNYLEEGLATHFAQRYALLNNHGIWEISNEKYFEAKELTLELLKIDNDIIKKIRAATPFISSITTETLRALNEKISEDLAERLTKKF